MVSAYFRHILNSTKAAVRQLIARCTPILTSVITSFRKVSITTTMLVVFVSLVSVMGVFSYTRGGASAAANNNLNFQGRLLSNTGATVPDGSYNIEFNLYTQQAPGGTTQWTEDYLNSASQGVTVKNGYFSVNLGSITSFPTSIAWDQQQWLGMTVRGTGSCAFAACTPADLEMTPRFKLTAVPYAFRAAALMDSTNTNAFTADDLIQKAPTLAQALNAATAAIRLNQTGAGGLLQLQGNGTDVFTVDNAGNTSAAGTLAVLGASATVGTSSQSGSLVLNDGSSNTTTIQSASTGSNLVLTLPGTTGTNGDCITTDGAGVLSFTTGCGGTLSVNPTANVRKAADETQNNVVNPTATLQNDDELLFNIGANETWSFRFVVMANANATPDLKFAVTAPGGATCKVGFNDQENAVAIGNAACGVSSGIIASATLEDTYEIFGTVVNGVTPGTVNLQWAQNTANALATIVRAGSFVNANRIAGAGQTAQAFIQSGNSFGALAVIGTNDNNALSVTTNGVERLRVLATGETQFADDVIASSAATGTTGTSTGVGAANTTTIQLAAAGAFADNDILFVDNSGGSGQDYYTRIVSGGGTTTLTVSPAVSYGTAAGYTGNATITKYTAQNIGATSTDYASQANRFFQGYFLGGVTVGAGSTTLSDGLLSRTLGDINITPGSGGILRVNGAIDATTITGDGAGITNINGANISATSIADGALSSNVALLTGSQSFSGLKTFGAGLTVTAGQNLTIGGDALSDLTGTNLFNNAGVLELVNNPSFTTSVTSPIFTGTAAVTVSSGGAGDLTLDSASNVLVLNDSTLLRTAAGTTALQLNDTSNTIFNITNTDVTAVANLNVEGSVTATSFVGSGAGLTGITDANLSSNVALLTGSQTFSGLKTFGAGLTVTPGQSLTVDGEAFNDLTGSNLTITGNALSLINNPAFTTSVTTPLLTSTAGLTIDSGSNTLTIAANDTTLLRTAAGTYNMDLSDAGTTVLSLTNNGGGVADLNLADGGLTTAGTSRLTNGGALQNITGLTIASGGASVTGTSSFASDVSFDGNTTLGNLNTDRLTITSQILGTNALVFQGAADNAFSTTLSISEPSANNTIVVPNESGTITLLGPAAAQIDAGTNSSLNINKTGASGNILTLSKSGTGVFTIGNGGATSIATTSTAALTISDAGAATDYFSVDTSGSIVRIGDSVADGVGTVFVLDTKNSAGDPTDVEGAQYYNSAYGTFRCNQGVRGWTDCLGTSKPNTRRTTRLDYQGSGTTFAGLGDIATVTANATTAIAATTTDPAMINYATSGANNNVTSISGNLNYSSSNTPSMQTYVDLVSTTTQRVWVGLTNQTSATMGASANPAGNYAAFRYDTSVVGETTWKCITKNNAVQTINNSGVTVSTNGIKMEIIETATEIIFKIDGTIVCSNTTTLPLANTMMRYSMSLTNLNATTHSYRIGWIFVDTDF